MPDAPFGLSDKECAVLRLLARGHDVKSAAAALGLSVHTVNERLREARSKTGASSSRGAARRGCSPNGKTPQNLSPRKSGFASRRPAAIGRLRRRARRRSAPAS